MMLKVASVLACLVLVPALTEQVQRYEANTSKKKKRTKAAGVCDCMPWADVYFSGKASCGRAEELYFLSKYGFSSAYAATEPITGLPHKVCVDFFKNFLTPSCVNVDLYPIPRDEMSDKTWCYVSNDCDELNGGEFATNQIGFAQGGWHNLESTGTLSWKICTPGGGDTILKEVSVGDLVELGIYSDVSLSRLIRLAYPVVEVTWGEAQFFMETLNDNYAVGKTLADCVDSVPAATSSWGDRLLEVHGIIGDIVKSQQPTILDSPAHGDNYHVIAGREVWQVQRIELGNMAYLGGHFAMEFNVNCTMGCATGEPREALDLETQ